MTGFASTHAFFLLILAFAAGSISVPTHALSPIRQPNPLDLEYLTGQQVVLTGGVEINNDHLRLNLTNESAREFRGFARISLGSDSEQKEIGMAALTLPPQETSLLKLASVVVSGSHYTLAIFDQELKLVLFRIAPIKRVSDSTPEIAVQLTPVSTKPARSNPAITASSANRPASAATTVQVDPANTVPETVEIQIQPRLLAGESPADPYILAFELVAQRPINDATMTVTIGSLKESKPVSINRQSSLQFKMPEFLQDQRISYQLTHKNGRLLAKGETDIGQLMTDDVITVAEVQTDRPSYELGDSARLTVVLEGRSPKGYRLEVTAKDGRGNVFFRDQRLGGANDQATPQEFNINLPRDLTLPLIFDYKVYDVESSQLFDSGDHEITISKPN